MLTILESTTYPGTTDEILVPKLTREEWTVGEDILIAFSPERVDPGNKEFQTGNIPKVVGGVTPTCNKMAKLFYGCIMDHVHTVNSPRVAEMVKLLENTFRSVNIGLVNELALMCDHMGINVWEVIDGAATKPFGFMPFYPGPGLGGHCIPIDPFYLSWKARASGFEARFIELAGQVNQFMPEHVVNKVSDALNSQGKAIKGSNILILGVAYKKNVGDTRESPAIDIVLKLLSKGANITYVDPYVPSFSVEDSDIPKAELTPGVLKKSDLAVIVTNHDMFDYAIIEQNAPLVLDTRNALKGKGISI
jgi:UDP-N-acetyl-D-glucosamine dehydrogenase